MSRNFSKPYMEPCRKYMTGLRILTIHMKAMNTINFEQTHKFGHVLLIINSYLPQLEQIMSWVPHQLRKMKY